MDYLLFFLLLIVLFSVYTIGPSVVALIHTYFGGKQYREFRSQLNPNTVRAPPKSKIVYLMLTIDSAFILLLAFLEILGAFFLFLFQLLVTGYDQLLFVFFVAAPGALLAYMAYATYNDVRYNRISAVKYEIVSGSDYRPDVDFDPVLRFRPIKFLISRNIYKEGMVSFGVLLSKRKFYSAGKESIEFQETIILKNTKEKDTITVFSVESGSSDVIVKSISPSTPLDIPALGSTRISLRCIISREREISPVTFRISVT